MRKRIIISGYYGFGNTGDEAVLSGILAAFRELEIDAGVTVLSSDPARTEAEHPGVESVHRYKLGPIIRAMRRADLVISGGGSLLQDATSAQSSYYYLAVLHLARFLRRRTMVYAQGVGPLNSARVQRAVLRALNKVNAISVRDEDSKTLLEAIGVNKIPIHISADPAFLLKPNLEAADEILSKNGLGGEELIGVSLRPWAHSEDWTTEVAKATSIIASELGIKVALIPMQEPRDVTVCEAINGATVLRNINCVETVKGIISRCSLIVGMRLHSLIFAASEGVPFVPIVYDPKVSSLAAMCGQPDGVRIESLNADTLASAVMSAWTEREALKMRLQAEAPALKRLALLSGELAAEILGL